jgi:hypothetical protein
VQIGIGIKLVPLKRRFEDQFCGNRNRRLQTTINGALVGEDSMHTSCSFPVRFLRLQPQAHMNAPDHEYILLQLDLADRFPHQASGGRIDLTRFQRASEGSRESTRGRGHHVI